MARTFYLTTFVNDKTFYCRLKREFMGHHVCMGFVLCLLLFLQTQIESEVVIQL